MTPNASIEYIIHAITISMAGYTKDLSIFEFLTTEIQSYFPQEIKVEVSTPQQHWYGISNLELYFKYPTYNIRVVILNKRNIILFPGELILDKDANSFLNKNHVDRTIFLDFSSIWNLPDGHAWWTIMVKDDDLRKTNPAEVMAALIKFKRNLI